MAGDAMNLATRLALQQLVDAADPSAVRASTPGLARLGAAYAAPSADLSPMWGPGVQAAPTVNMAPSPVWQAAAPQRRAPTAPREPWGRVRDWRLGGDLDTSGHGSVASASQGASPYAQPSQNSVTPPPPRAAPPAARALTPQQVRAYMARTSGAQMQTPPRAATAQRSTGTVRQPVTHSATARIGAPRSPRLLERQMTTIRK